MIWGLDLTAHSGADHIVEGFGINLVDMSPRDSQVLYEPTASDHLLATKLARRAGEALLKVRSRLINADQSTLRSTGDKISHELITGALARERPNDAVLSEEGKDDPRRLESDRVWIIDPLDGTREFGEPPRTDWAVHVALCERGLPTAAAVALPAVGVVLTTDRTPFLAATSPARPRVMASRTRPGRAAEIVASAISGDVVSLGSAGAKAMAVVRGEAEVYVHTGGQFEWDSCAPVGVCLTAGLHASRIDGSQLVYNSADPYLPDLLICRPELKDDCLDALRCL